MSDDIFTKEEYEKIGRELVEHGAWQRHEQDRKDESYSILGIKLPYSENLSSKGSRIDAVLRKINSREE